MSVSRNTALKAVRTLIEFIGDNPDRAGLLDTPGRVLDAWESAWGKGYLEPQFETTIFAHEEGTYYNEMIVEKDILFFSHCEHHITPFYGVAHVGYIPAMKGIVGLSKLARIVEHFASRLQTQERLGIQIANYIVSQVSPSCGVALEATHLCMASRGCRQPNTRTRTMALRGDFLHDDGTHAEFIQQVLSK